MRIFQKKIEDNFTRINLLSFKLKRNETDNKNLIKKLYDIDIRENTSDYYVALEIFKNEQYRPLCLDNDVKVIIDAGANIGCTSVYFARKYPNALILSIEPDNDNFKLLQHNARKYSNIIPILAGLWGENTYLQVVDNGYGEWGRQTMATGSPVNGNMLKAITISSLIEKYNIPIIDILKIDVEGAEKSIFDNDCSWLRKVRILGIELHDRMLTGCSNSFFRCMADYPEFDLSVHHEDIIMKNRNY